VGGGTSVGGEIWILPCRMLRVLGLLCRPGVVGERNFVQGMIPELLPMLLLLLLVLFLFLLVVILNFTGRLSNRVWKVLFPLGGVELSDEVGDMDDPNPNPEPITTPLPRSFSRCNRSRRRTFLNRPALPFLIMGVFDFGSLFFELLLLAMGKDFVFGRTNAVSNASDIVNSCCCFVAFVVACFGASYPR
jgi:hypothetical protein